MHEKDALALLRSQRHVFLNHLQVIAGWLQLGKPERAADHVAKAADELAAQGAALAGAPAEIGFALLQVLEHAELHALQVSVKVDSPPPPAAAGKVREFLLAAVKAAQDLPEERRALQVLVTSDKLIVSFPEPVAMPGAAGASVSYEAALQ